MIFVGLHNCYISLFFADDTNLFCLCKKFHRSPGNSRSGIARKRFDINKFLLNLDKTKLIAFGNRKINADVQLKINEAEIERVNENTFLGVMIDHKLNWKPHINDMKSKISSKAKDVWDQRSLLVLYSSLFHKTVSMVILIYAFFVLFLLYI